MLKIVKNLVLACGKGSKFVSADFGGEKMMTSVLFIVGENFY